jgi:cation transport regulator ChaC
MSINTMEINRGLNRFEDQERVWLFGYGSLIWKADFPFLDRRPARILGWSRRFWQGSHDHRGTPEAPGRVATLVPAPDAACVGMAYLITPEVFDHLDLREKNGYLREVITLHFLEGGVSEGLIYVAGPDNAAFLGEASESEIARHIADAHGPSGLNRDYLLHLAQALRDLNAHDDHVFAIERELLALDAVSRDQGR